MPYLTNISVFNLTELPSRLAIIGGGAIGIEFAQAFARFGSKVTVVVRGSRILPKVWCGVTTLEWSNFFYYLLI